MKNNDKMDLFNESLTNEEILSYVDENSLHPEDIKKDDVNIITHSLLNKLNIPLVKELFERMKRVSPNYLLIISSLKENVVELIDYLVIERGIKINHIRNEMNAFICSSIGNNYENTKRLIELKADINSETNEGTYIMKKIVMGIKDPINKLLIDSGCDIQYITHKNGNLMERLLECGTVGLGIFEYIVNTRDDIDFSIPYNYDSKTFNVKPNLLMHFLKSEHYSDELMIKLIDKCEDLHYKDANQETILFYSLNEKILDYLIKIKKMKWNIRNVNRDTAFMVSCSRSIVTFNYFIKNLEIDFEDKDEYGDTALMNCIESRNYEKFSKLLELNVNVNVINKHGYCPLTLALRENYGDLNLNFVKDLIKYGSMLHSTKLMKYKFHKNIHEALMLMEGLENFEEFLINNKEMLCKASDDCKKYVERYV